MKLITIFFLFVLIGCINSNQSSNNNKPIDPQIYEVALVVDNNSKNTGKIIYLPKNSTTNLYIRLNPQIKSPKESYDLDISSDDSSVFSILPTTCKINAENDCPIVINTTENVNSSGNLTIKVHDIQSPNDITLKRIKIIGE
jgi:hypothetical protein